MFAKLLFLFILMSFSITSKSSITIDARENVEAAISQYRSIFAPDEEGRYPTAIREDIILLIDASKGFDVGWLRVNPKIRSVDVRIKVYAFRSGNNSKPVTFNLFDLQNYRTTSRINQKLNWIQ